eukprot:TRINITY_DN1510_c0_g1_i1.p1 TRINITY_DN1510_c0_g1~~TRINITY_DN1510_c0_g1_i1.p1  ORF type:complete len:693 (-),score=170.37 TRINITY_DN1510_c0_g1_i1:138-2183(-)
MSTIDASLEQYYAQRNPVVSLMECKKAFALLTEKEKKYAHGLSLASWAGIYIATLQTSPESPEIFSLFQKLFSAVPFEQVKEKAVSSGVTEADFVSFEEYVVFFYDNVGNYLSFGDTKFVPRCSKETFLKIIEAASVEGALEDAKKCVDALYSLEKNVRELGFYPGGITTYYSPDIEKSDVDFVDAAMNERGLNPYNTRVFRNQSGYDIRVASVQKDTQTFTYKDKTINIIYGDHSEYLVNVVVGLKIALENVANEHQKQMIIDYIKFFEEGHIDIHKDAQRSWIKDKSPSVESNIGFIESYRDPQGVRGEWEGWVAVVDKVVSAQFGTLVAAAETFIEKLPWPKEFEKDRFLKPDFTSLEVIAFSSSGVPAGINIPNYNDIRQDEGFKNVSLGNVIRSRYTSTGPVAFLKTSDEPLFNEMTDAAFAVQVGIHELLGHGSGKLLQEVEAGQFNFDKETVKDPLTQELVQSYYGPGQTYNSLFSSLGQPMEECRAEACGLYLCGDADLLKIFGYGEDKAGDVTYVNWLTMARKGLQALEFYSSDTKKWKQAHMHARFALFNVMLRAGEDFVTIDESGELPVVVVDRSKIATVGVPAIGSFLQKIMVYKSTANVTAARAMFEDYCTIDSNYLRLRDIVMSNKKPRNVFVQPHIFLKDGQVEIETFTPTPAGLVKSYVTRFASA